MVDCRRRSCDQAGHDAHPNSSCSTRCARGKLKTRACSGERTSAPTAKTQVLLDPKTPPHRARFSGGERSHATSLAAIARRTASPCRTEQQTGEEPLNVVTYDKVTLNPNLPAGAFRLKILSARTPGADRRLNETGDQQIFRNALTGRIRAEDEAAWRQPAAGDIAGRASRSREVVPSITQRQMPRRQRNRSASSRHCRSRSAWTTRNASERGRHRCDSAMASSPSVRPALHTVTNRQAAPAIAVEYVICPRPSIVELSS